MIESRTNANKELIPYSQKTVRVRTPRDGHRKSITVLGTRDIPRNFPIGRLNNYNKTMKKHKGPLSLTSALESIEESKAESSRMHDVMKEDSGGILFDVDNLAQGSARLASALRRFSIIGKVASFDRNAPPKEKL